MENPSPEVLREATREASEDTPSHCAARSEPETRAGAPLRSQLISVMTHQGRSKPSCLSTALFVSLFAQRGPN